jgi:hypothetical protein
MCRYTRSSLEYDVSSGELAERIVDEDQRSILIESYDICEPIIGQISEVDLLAIDITVVGDHPSRSELAPSIEEELDISILIDDDEILDAIRIHITMSIVSDPRSSATGYDRSDTPIDAIDLGTCSSMIDMSNRISHIDEPIRMEKSGRLPDRITSSIGEEHSIVASPSDS